MFARYDTDCDGTINTAELMDVFKEIGKVVPEEDVKAMIALADKSNTGTLNYEEFISLALD